LLLAIGLPRQIAAFSMGFWLGTTNGMLVATLAACGGCIITYLTARFFLHEQIKRRFPAQQQSLSSFFASNTLQKALIIRLLPIGSNFITNLVAGAVSAPAWQYHIGTCIGFLPQMALFAMLGAGIRVGETDQILLSVALILVAGGLSYRLYRQSRKRLPVQAS